MSNWLYTIVGFLGGSLITLLTVLIVTYNATVKKGKK